ncbi:MAG TPA: efflux RND transporter periplasmic adaptor subunit [Terriglobales bacterium]|nr:efflux RND transporter periplasmic adaptor subunit [Terriglobales bacterium]
MGIQKSVVTVPVADFAGTLLSQQEVIPRAEATAEQVAELIPGAAVVVYVIEDQGNPAWTAKATVGEVGVNEVIEFHHGPLGAVADKKGVEVFGGANLKRENYAHLDTRRTVVSLGYVPLLVKETLIGAIELISYQEAFPVALLAQLNGVADLAAPAIASALAYESERNTSLQSISRVAQMYDLEKVFNSNLELDSLLDAIASKFHEILRCQAVNVWMVDGEAVKLVRRAGQDPTTELETLQNAGEGVPGDVSDNGEPVLIDDPEDPRLQKRNARIGERVVFSLIAAPLMDRESLVGVVEAINRLDGLPFDEDDQFLLTNISETANNALHNASLLLAERKVEILETLVRVSREITSTLDIGRVLQAIVNDTQAVLSYDRAAIALEERGIIQLKAVSGSPQINTSDPTIKLLKEMLEWASLSEEEIHVTQHGDEIDVSRESSRAKFSEYFAVTGARAFYAIPLDDDQGPLGILSFESNDPDFMTRAHLEVVRVLAAQATVALRNASLYRDVPFISVLEPVLEKKRRFLAMEKRRRMLWLASAAAVALFFVFFPIPMRLAGDATIAPFRKAQVTPSFDGVVEAVYVREGDRVQAGTILADLEDWDLRAAVAAAHAKYTTAVAEMNHALAANDGTEAGIQRVQAEYWAAELKRAQQRLEKTHLRSPLDGVVATPRVENFVGEHLAPGDSFIEVIDSRESSIDVGIDEQDAVLLQPGRRATIKLDAYPTRSFPGQVQVISPMSSVENENRIYYARVLVPNQDGVIRAGMHGRGKVMAGWRPIGYVLFRRPAMWIYSKLWSWFGW